MRRQFDALGGFAGRHIPRAFLICPTVTRLLKPQVKVGDIDHQAIARFDHRLILRSTILKTMCPYMS
jgi:hypothetical protein